MEEVATAGQSPGLYRSILGNHGNGAGGGTMEAEARAAGLPLPGSGQVAWRG
jgi:hypothetical protein